MIRLPAELRQFHAHCEHHIQQDAQEEGQFWRRTNEGGAQENGKTPVPGKCDPSKLKD